MNTLINDIIYNWLPTSLSNPLRLSLAYGMAIIGLGLVLLLTDFIAKKIFLKLLEKWVSRSKNKIDDVLFEKKIFHRLAHLVPAIILYLSAPIFGVGQELIQKAIALFITLLIILVIYRFIDALVLIYNTYDFSKGRPIKGLMQIVKIVVGAFALGMLLVIFVGSKTASVVFGSIGGLSAVLVLIFRDSILGFVAGIQLSSGHLLKVGDWLQMDKFGADGEVVDISLTKIVVRNWDKTYTSIPAFKFLEESFVNWQGMISAGGRRIKRAILLDVSTVGFLSAQEIEALKSFSLLENYLLGKEKELALYNQEKGTYNQRKLTNIGTLRVYLTAYLESRDDIYQEGFTLMVRQLASTDKGIPLEVYCFTKDTAWTRYEEIQADIFDHIFAIIPYFGLRLYQQPSGEDFRQVYHKIQKGAESHGEG